MDVYGKNTSVEANASAWVPLTTMFVFWETTLPQHIFLMFPYLGVCSFLLLVYFRTTATGNGVKLLGNPKIKSMFETLTSLTHYYPCGQLYGSIQLTSTS